MDIGELLQLELVRHVLSVVILIAIPLAMLSCILVLKGWALMGDAISHAVLPGVIFASLLGLPFWIGALAAGLLFSIITGFVQANSTLKPDTIVGVIFSGMFGLGVVLYAVNPSNVRFEHILFGDLFGVANHELLEITLVAAALSIFVFCKRKDLLLCAFDQGQATVVGLSITLLHYLLLVMVLLGVVMSLKIVGSLLAVSFLIIPGAAGFLLSNKFDFMLIASVCVAVLSSVVGVFLCFYLDTAPAPTIVLFMTTMFFAVFVSKWCTLKQ